MVASIPVKSWFILLFAKKYSVKKCNNLYLGLVTPGNTKGGSITVPLTSCLTDLNQLYDN
jgi:hypothetical protein